MGKCGVHIANEEADFILRPIPVDDIAVTESVRIAGIFSAFLQFYRVQFLPPDQRPMPNGRPAQ
jgi:hypothetical protein